MHAHIYKNSLMRTFIRGRHVFSTTHPCFSLCLQWHPRSNIRMREYIYIYIHFDFSFVLLYEAI